MKYLSKSWLIRCSYEEDEILLIEYMAQFIQGTNEKQQRIVKYKQLKQRDAAIILGERNCPILQ